MKRTKEGCFQNSNDLTMVSGCREFTGEDLTYRARRQFLKRKQRQWLDQSIKQKKERLQKQKQIDSLYDEQSAYLTKVGGYLQSKFLNTKENVLKKTIQQNKVMENEKKQISFRQKSNKRREELQQVLLLNKNGEQRPFYSDL